MIWRAPSRLLVAVSAIGLTLVAAPAQAAEQSLTITHVEPGDGEVSVLLSVPEGLAVDLDDVGVTIAGTTVDAFAQVAGRGGVVVRRTTILAIDTSRSMARRDRFVAAKAAADIYLDQVPDDVYIGIVTFDSSVETALAPTLDRDEAKDVVDGLSLALQTRLNEGVIEAAALAGTDGQRSLLVLSDGRDTSDVPVDDVVSAVEEAGVRVDVVALDQSGNALTPLEAMSEAGSGSVISADPDALAEAFASEASSLARQIQVTADLPDSVTAAEATVQVSVPSGAQVLSASTFSVIQDAAPSSPDLRSGNRSSIQIPKTVMYGGVAALGLGLLILLGGMMLAVSSRTAPASAEERIAAYGVGGGPDAGGHAGQSVSLDQAKSAATSVLSHNRGLEARIEARLEAAGSDFKPAEWLLLHSAIIIVAGVVGMLISSGSLLVALLCMIVGLVLPWLWLGRKRKKRIKAFNSGLADTLQLMSGSLSAGMSLAQSIDSVVREGNEPISGEFKRVLIEVRLGVSVEDAMAAVATRLESKDFEWVVMAIRIQREVGGNLAELLNIVAGTLRERDYLRRQVQTLAAEGKLSAYILSGLPILVMGYLLSFRREYVMPLFTTGMGLVFLVGAVLLLTMGGFVMSRIIKVEV